MNKYHHIDILRKQIAFHKAGIETGAKMSAAQNEWLEKAEKKIFWHQVQFDAAERILGKTPKNQDEAAQIVRNYNQNQIALSR